MKKSPMEIMPNLSPMDINYQQNKYCNNPDGTLCNTDVAQTIDELDLAEIPTDYSLEPPLDDYITELNDECISSVSRDEDVTAVAVKKITKTKAKREKKEKTKGSDK